MTNLLPKSITKSILFATIPATCIAQSLMIDDFLVPSPSLKVNINPQESTSFTLSNSGTIGGTRGVTLTNNYPSPGIRSSLYFSDSPTIIGSGRLNSASLSLPTGGGVTGDVDLSFIYDANGTGLGANLTAYPEIAFLWEGDHHGFNNSSFVSLTLEDSLGNTHAEIFSYPVMANENYFIETLKWDTDDFSNAGVNITDVDKITLHINTDASADYTFSSFTLIPEPSSVLVMTLSCGAFLFRRKR